MDRRFFVAALSLFPCMISTRPSFSDDNPVLHVFILAGQSNMAGADSNVVEPTGFRQTPADRATRFSAAPLPYGAKSSLYVPWEELQGHRLGNQLVHGPEVGLARSLHEDSWRNVAMIKVFANFGRNAESWPWGKGGYLFKAWTKFVDDRLEELRDQGHSVRVSGFAWHQGIDDAIHGKLAHHYERNLSDLIGALRNRYATRDTPFVLARSVNSRIAQPTPDPEMKSPMAIVRRAQNRIAKTVSGVATIDVDDCPTSALIIFSNGQLVIGRRYGAAFKRSTQGHRRVLNWMFS